MPAQKITRIFTGCLRTTVYLSRNHLLPVLLKSAREGTKTELA